MTKAPATYPDEPEPDPEGTVISHGPGPVNTTITLIHAHPGQVAAAAGTINWTWAAVTR